MNWDAQDAWMRVISKGDLFLYSISKMATKRNAQRADQPVMQCVEDEHRQRRDHCPFFSHAVATNYAELPHENIAGRVPRPKRHLL